MKAKLILPLALLIFAIIVFMPPIIHGYIYPTIGHDTVAHLEILDKVKIGSPIPVYWGDSTDVREVRYYAYYIIGYPLDIVSRIFNVSKDVLFFWFNYLALFGVGVSLLFIFKNLISLSAGLSALFIPTFTSYGILLYFYSGVIFNIINIGIILPFICYFVIKVLTTKKKRYWVGVVLLSALFLVFHTTGMYMPFFVVAGYAIYIIYKIVKKQHIRKRHILISLVLLISSTLFVIFNPLVIKLGQSDGVSGIQLLSQSLFYYLSATICAAIVISIVYLFIKRKLINTIERLVIMVFGVLTLILLPAMFIGISPQPFRQGLDFAILLSLVATVLVGIIIRLDKNHFMAILLICLIIGGTFIHVKGWFGYNSALEKVDIEAINYVNSLSVKSFSCTKNIDYAIYGRYLDEEYWTSGGDVVIIRSLPMRSGESNVKYGIVKLVGTRKVINKFTDGNIEIEIYK